MPTMDLQHGEHLGATLSRLLGLDCRAARAGGHRTRFPGICVADRCTCTAGGGSAGRSPHLQLVQPQAPVLHLEKELRRQRAAELAQRVLVLPQPQLERLRCQRIGESRYFDLHDPYIAKPSPT